MLTNALLSQLFSALDALSDVGILHTDIKSDNIMFVGESDLKVKLIDFGLAMPAAAATPGMHVQPVPCRCLYPKCLLLFYIILCGHLRLACRLLILSSRLPSSGLQKYSSACPSATALTCGHVAASSRCSTSKNFSSKWTPPMQW